MTDTQHDDDDDVILNAFEPEPDPVVEPSNQDDEDDVVISDPTPQRTVENDELEYPGDAIDFRGETIESLSGLAQARSESLGQKEFANRVRQTGSWENIIFRALDEQTLEEHRIQEAIASLSEDDRKAMAHRYRNEGVTLRTAAIGSKSPPKGEVKVLSGSEALIAFESVTSGGASVSRGGGYRIPLYNSGITVDIVAPTGNDLQTMLTNCIIIDRELGASQGAHYFTYNDQLYKAQILNFLQPLIVNSSYSDWRKKGKLWSVIKLPDLQALVMTVAAICHRDGFDGFIVRCTRPTTPESPDQCTYTETITANLFEMIVTRFSAMSRDAITFMGAARSGKVHSLSDIANYQSLLGLEGERLTFGNVTFTMRIPTLAEHLDAGAKFLSDIKNEVEGDNTEGQYNQLGFRYMRTFLPWIATVEAETNDGGVWKTSDRDVIVRQLETLNDIDHDDKIRTALRHYIDKSQLTYVGYPVLPCPQCEHVAETPSGMRTIDPFSAFFTIASLYLTKSE